MTNDKNSKQNQPSGYPVGVKPAVEKREGAANAKERLG
jgi:hypothetical protein